ncbi:peptidoglycan editing factor PgeF [Pseudaquabacterium pictum]|uniref:Purine nucleoside phosphorylase n=1 Tax=Pseudaquabacterium pictum TaxID=2315236 RepID=A0A480AHE6_9BURK|nr:peptidoglycan editing factor PgeF [Rubrivivax pictus]GCL61061.1 laccase domain protein [Rubrivivax pictus]
MPAEPEAVLLPDAIRPGWPAPPAITALMSTRVGGVSVSPFDSLNLRPPALGGEGVDAADAVLENQRRFAQALGAQPVWLNQVHGADVLRLTPDHLAPGAPLLRADASICTTPGIACTVLVADCLPVLFCSADGRAVGAAHAGWRGLAGGVLDHTVAALCAAAGCAPDKLLAWLGPCIGPDAFEVGADVLQAFGADPQTLAPADAALFRFSPRPDGSTRWRADLPGLARRRLAALGLTQVHGGHWCTVAHGSRFFSFRRQPRTGRLAAAIAIRGAG